MNANLSVKRNQGSPGSYLSNDLDGISDMTFAMEIPTNTFTAQAIQLMNNDTDNNKINTSPKASSFTKEKVIKSAAYISKEKEPDNSDTNYIPDYTIPNTYDEKAINIFEDAPSDEG